MFYKVNDLGNDFFSYGQKPKKSNQKQVSSQFCEHITKVWAPAQGPLQCLSWPVHWPQIPSRAVCVPAPVLQALPRGWLWRVTCLSHTIFSARCMWLTAVEVALRRAVFVSSCELSFSNVTHLHEMLLVRQPDWMVFALGQQCMTKVS